MLIKHNGFIQGKIVHSTSKILFREDAFFVTGRMLERYNSNFRIIFLFSFQGHNYELEEQGSPTI